MFSDQSRLLVLIIACTCLWTLESLAPLNPYGKDRLRRALPNIGLTTLLVVTNLALSFISAEIAAVGEKARVGLLFVVTLSPVTCAITGIVFLDLFAYIAHVMMHKSWLGWQFHRVHHSEPEVNVTTAFRQHPGETLWRALWQMLAMAIFGLPLWVVVVYLLLSALNAQLEHANIRISDSVDRWLRLIVVTPNMHKVHHSRDQKETDTNYANIFSVWDKLFGTYTPRTDFATLRYGLDGFDGDREQKFIALLKLPFLKTG